MPLNRGVNDPVDPPAARGAEPRLGFRPGERRRGVPGDFGFGDPDDPPEPTRAQRPRGDEAADLPDGKVEPLGDLVDREEAGSHAAPFRSEADLWARCRSISVER